MTWKFEHVSPSQIEVWLSCQGKWYWQYPMGFKPPSSGGQLVGTACHTIEENVIGGTEDCGRKNDAQDRYRDIVRPALPKLFELRGLVEKGALVETEMKRTLRNGLVLKGRIDFLHVTRPTALVVDHKNLGDLDKYAKTEEALRTDIQMNAYAYEALCRDGGIRSVRVAHSVCQTRNRPLHRYTETELSAKEIHAAWTRIQDISDKMIETSKFTSPADVPKNRDACSKFGGCPHLSRCEALWGVSSTPYAGIESAPIVLTDPLTQENRMSTGSIPANVLAALGVKAPAAGRSPLLPPEAPTDPRTAKAQAAQVAAQQPATPPANVLTALGAKPTAQQVASVAAQQVAAKPATPPAPVEETPADPAMLLLSLGWTVEEVNSMTDACFEKAAKHKVKREDVEVVLGEAEADGFRAIEDVVEKAPPAPVARTQRVTRVPATPAVADPTQVTGEQLQTAIEQGDTATVHRAADQAVATQQAEAKRRGRPPGAKNKATLERERLEAEKAGILAATAPQVAVVPVTFEDTMRTDNGQQGQATVEECEENDVVPDTQHTYAARVGIIVEQNQKLEGYVALVEKLEKEKAELQASLAERTAYIQGREKALAEMEERASKETVALRRELTALREANADLLVKTNGGSTDGFTLYIDCLPETPGVAFRTLDTVLAPFMELAAKNYKNEKTGQPEPLTHYSLIPFGKGPAAVVAYLLANLGEVVQPGILYVDSRSPCAAAAVEVLRPKADVIVSARGR